MSANVLWVEAPDRPGLVHAVTGVLFRHGVNIVSNHEFVDRDSGLFFMRTEFQGISDSNNMARDLGAVLPTGATFELPPPERRRIVILASKEHHCLADLLVRHSFGELYAHIVGVISNHDCLRDLTEKFGIPFVHISHEDLNRSEHETKFQQALTEFRPELIVLAKYMRVLSSEFVAPWKNRMVNIHHSFLPAFVGSRPYHQAFQRGVKVIGATAHFVTDQLDEGPIIVQQIIPVNHAFQPEDLIRAGRDVEQIVLARALKLVLEDRVFLNGNRTVIFD